MRKCKTCGPTEKSAVTVPIATAEPGDLLEVGDGIKLRGEPVEASNPYLGPYASAEVSEPATGPISVIQTPEHIEIWIGPVLVLSQTL